MDRDLPAQARQPLARSRLQRNGPEGLDDCGALELLLAMGAPEPEAVLLASRLLERYGDLRAVLDGPIDELASIEGMDDSRALGLKIVRATAALYLERGVERDDSARDASRLEGLWRMRIGPLPNEVFEVAYLDGANRLLHDGIQRLSEGTIDRAVIYPRRILETALKRGAAAVVLAHNHPNGHLQPSEHDKLLTRSVVLAAETIGLTVLDHFVVTANATFSLRKAGLL